MKKSKIWAGRLTRTLTGVTALGLITASALSPVMAAQDVAITPNEVSQYGYYVDNYKNNSSSNMTPQTNPSIGVLSEMLNYFTPGTAWNNGTILNEKIHQMNLTKTSEINQNSTDAQKKQAYLDDRRDQNYSMISGLGVYADAFIKGTNAGTTIPDTVAADANTVKYDDKGNNNGTWADTNSQYGAIVNLVNTVRNGAASTSSAKKYYKYMRPFRWSELSENQPMISIIPSLQPCRSADPSNDGGFPSGHTNAAYLSGISMAYAVPQQYSQMLLRASELGNNRIVAGMHSCLDVIGGRIMATAIAAANLNDASNAAAKEAAVAAGSQLVSSVSDTSDYKTYQQDRALYLSRMTYGITSDQDTTKPMVVPKGAEALLESRFPYLNADQRRYVLYTTGISSGYSVLDDAEGWGRINLFDASNGYGAFATDVTVNMDASKGGFSAADNWKNDISGTGSLTKEGSGMLVLSGHNTYSGTTTVNAGTLRADSQSAFGKGNVVNNSTIVENTDTSFSVESNFTQEHDGVLELTISNADDFLKISGNATFGGTLILNFTNGFVPQDGFKAISCGQSSSQFDSVQVNGLEGTQKKVVYTANGLEVVTNGQQGDTDHGQNSGSAGTESGTASDTTGTDVSADDTGNQSETSGSLTNPKTADTSETAFFVIVLVLSASFVFVCKKKRVISEL
jgi:autotransporter-associated beta strand protein